ncbi:hypothetical protein [Candidatus Borrarchaeum sp.]|uniref:hypothetical protein n=1 Tax=Candidatus Borrarchaeum sp. TaxID=2846742 RepID=UPI00257D8BA5|nr:hypothetical protein [Candidatus Borrarchaeum sp.]
MAKKMAIPWEFKYKFAMGGWTAYLKAYHYAIREKYGADAALEIYERTCKMDDRIKSFTNAVLKVFELEGNDAETIGRWWDIWHELTGTEGTILEWSKTICRVKVTKCPTTTVPKDISGWSIIRAKLITKAINPKAVFERPKAMCAGDSYCEYVWKIEESTPIKGAEETMTKKRVIPWELKYKFAMGGWAAYLKAYHYAIREKYGADAALEIYERISTMDDRAKKGTQTLLNIFNLEGNDIETIRKWWEIWWELIGIEGTWLEQSKTCLRNKITKCPYKTEPKDISDWALIFCDINAKTINPKATCERPKGMCARDPYCEYVWIIEE